VAGIFHGGISAGGVIGSSPPAFDCFECTTSRPATFVAVFAIKRLVAAVRAAD